MIFRKKAQFYPFESVFVRLIRIFLDSIDDRVSDIPSSKHNKNPSEPSNYAPPVLGSNGHKSPEDKKKDEEARQKFLDKEKEEKEMRKNEEKVDTDPYSFLRNTITKDSVIKKYAVDEKQPDKRKFIPYNEFVKTDQYKAIKTQRDRLPKADNSFGSQVKSMYDAVKTLPKVALYKTPFGAIKAKLKNRKTIKELKNGSDKSVYFLLPGEKMPRATTIEMARAAEDKGMLPYMLQVKYKNLEHMGDEGKYVEAAKLTHEQVMRMYNKAKINEPEKRTKTTMIKNSSFDGYKYKAPIETTRKKDMMYGHSSGGRTAQTYAQHESIKKTGIGSIMAVAGDMHNYGYEQKNTYAQKAMGAVYPINKYNVKKSGQARESAINSLTGGTPHIPVHAVYGANDKLVLPKDTASPYNSTTHVVNKNHFQTSGIDKVTSKDLLDHHLNMHKTYEGGKGSGRIVPKGSDYYKSDMYKRA